MQLGYVNQLLHISFCMIDVATVTSQKVACRFLLCFPRSEIDKKYTFSFLRKSSHLWNIITEIPTCILN